MKIWYDACTGKQVRYGIAILNRLRALGHKVMLTTRDHKDTLPLAELLKENLVFIILNVMFLSMMISFIYLQSSSVHLMEEENAKKIALLIDGSKPGTEIQINFKDFFEKAEEGGISKESSIKIDNEKNLVIIKGSKKSFYEYSYFNDVNVKYNFEGDFLILEIV